MMLYNTTPSEDRTLNLAENNEGLVGDLLDIIRRLDGEIERLSNKLEEMEAGNEHRLP